jgi:hypothetical protein
MSMPQMESETRRALNSLFNDNKLKLGLFGVNVSNGCAITTLEGSPQSHVADESGDCTSCRPVWL